MIDNTRNLNGITPKYFDNITKTVFAPLYPVVARQIVERCRTKDGVCIDLGSGPAPLAIALAKISDLKIYALDISKEMCRLADKNIKTEGLSKKITTVTSDVHDMPYPDNFADLIVSRGSVFFWEDKTKAFKEIYRVLKPNGITYIGGGFGTADLRMKVMNEMEKIVPEWKKDVKERLGTNTIETFKDALNDAKILNYDMIDDDSGLWILIRK